MQVYFSNSSSFCVFRNSPRALSTSLLLKSTASENNDKIWLLKIFFLYFINLKMVMPNQIIYWYNKVGVDVRIN